MLKLSSLISPKINKSQKRVGRGIGSGKGGHTTGKGNKGQRSRSGYKKAGKFFEGGQNPITKRVPFLKGVSNQGRTRGYFMSKVVNRPIKLSELAESVKDGDKVTNDTLLDVGLITIKTHKDLDVKVLWDKDIERKLHLEGIKTSKKAQAAIEKAGGSVVA